MSEYFLRKVKLGSFQNTRMLNRRYNQVSRGPPCVLAIEQSTALLDSVAPEVKVNWLGSTFKD